jgi:hypothetical protein
MSARGDPTESPPYVRFAPVATDFVHGGERPLVPIGTIMQCSKFASVSAAILGLIRSNRYLAGAP